MDNSFETACYEAGCEVFDLRIEADPCRCLGLVVFELRMPTMPNAYSLTLPRLSWHGITGGGEYLSTLILMYVFSGVLSPGDRDPCFAFLTPLAERCLDLRRFPIFDDSKPIF